MRMTIATLGVGVLMVVLAAWAATAQAQGKDAKSQAQVCTLKVAGMTCGGCAAAVKMAAKRVDGVRDAKVSLEKGTAVITYDATKTDPGAIAKVITKDTGFKAEVAKRLNHSPSA